MKTPRLHEGTARRNAFKYADDDRHRADPLGGRAGPTIWTVPPPRSTPHEARRELARRYLHVFGPATAEAFAHWAGIGPATRRAAFDGARAGR